jgi:hypothetical protein
MYKKQQLLLTKKEIYNQHQLKHWENSVSESAFRKRIRNWRTIQQAIETPKLYANEYQVEQQKKKAEPHASDIEKQLVEENYTLKEEKNELQAELRSIIQWFKRSYKVIIGDEIFYEVKYFEKIISSYRRKYILLAIGFFLLGGLTFWGCYFNSRLNSFLIFKYITLWKNNYQQLESS